MNGVFLRKYLADQGMLKDKFNLNISLRPFPLNKQFQGIMKAAAGTTSAILMVIAWMMISDALIQNVIKERQKNIKH